MKLKGWTVVVEEAGEECLVYIDAGKRCPYMFPTRKEARAFTHEYENRWWRKCRVVRASFITE